MKSVKNLPASVRQRLLNRAKIDNRAFSELVQYYAMERFLYRLSISAHSDRFILKGALMLRVWRSPEFRPTMDIDMLGITSNDEKSIVAQIRDIISVDAVPDGLRFDPESVQSERTAVDADYHGIRIRFRGTLENVRISMQVDIGFSDIIYPGPEEAELPTLLDFPAPKLLCYSRESAIAEKFETLVKLGALNSRMKDFYDIWLLSRLFEFDGAKLSEAIRLTFARRGTELPTRIEAFDESFIASKQIQWIAFWKRLQHDHVPASFTDIVAGVKEFLEPPASGLLNSRIPKKWIASGPWT
jgi:hypothetical protein